MTPELIAEQRAKGWVDFHPEDFCHRCGGKNVPSWFVSSDRFNAARSALEDWPGSDIVCPGCFAEGHERASGLTCTWELVPAGNFVATERPGSASCRYPVPSTPDKETTDE